MPAATITAASLPAPITQASLAEFYILHLPDVLGPLFDDYVASGTRYLVFQKVLGPEAAQTIYFRIDLPASAPSTITWTPYRTWNATNHTGTGSMTTSYTSVTASTQLDILKIVHPELSGYVTRQGSALDGLLVYRPAEKSPLWDLDLHPYFWTARAVIALSPANPGGNTHPYGPVTLNSSIPSLGLTTVNPVTGKREVAPGVCIAGAYGVFGAFSADVRQAAANGLAALDTLQVTPGVEEYLLLHTSSPYLCIRSV